MSNIAVLPQQSIANYQQRDLVDAFLANKSPTTIRAYRNDLEDFRAFAGTDTAQDAAQLLINLRHGDANGFALDYRDSLVKRGLAPATINRRLAALRSIVKLAQVLGQVSWALQVPSVKSESYRNTAGPGKTAFQSMLLEARAQAPRKAARDTLLLRLLHDMGLRRNEVVTLDIGDLDIANSKLAVTGKGKTEAVWLTVPAPTMVALEHWLSFRDESLAPLVTNFDRQKRNGGRLTGGSVYDIVKRLGQGAGVDTRPHGLRHLGITTALDVTGGDIRAVQRFSRHADPRVLQRYDDNLSDLGGDVAAQVAATIE